MIAEEIENQTVLTLLAKPVRRVEVVIGKFLGILLLIAAAFVLMAAVSLVTVWWTEAKVEKPRTNALLAVADLPAATTGQGALLVSSSYRDVAASRGGTGADYLRSLGDVLLLSTGQSSLLVARVPLSETHGQAEASPGLASLVREALGMVSSRTGTLLGAFALAFVHVMIIAAVAVAVSTRLPLVFNGLLCGAVFVLGNISIGLGRALLEADARAGGGLGGALLHAATWPAIAVCYWLPRFEYFNLTETLSVGGEDRINPGLWTYGILYGLAYTMLMLGVAVLLFRRREVA